MDATSGSHRFRAISERHRLFRQPNQAWMINFRVANLERMIAQLRAKGIAVALDPEIYPNDRFRLSDPEGNPIELWEPKAESDG